MASWTCFTRTLALVAGAFAGEALALEVRTRNVQAPIELKAQRSTHKMQVQLELAARDAEVSEMWQKMQDEESPWSALPAGDDSNGRNICLRGKQVPDFYVLGVQKCATSSLANNLMGAGMSNVHGDLNPKEFHWFDHRMDYSLVGLDGWEANKQEWLSWMPDCPAPVDGVAPRNVLADFTPDYFRIVPRPKQFTPVPGDWMKVQELDLLAPKKMIDMYGEERTSKLQFAVMFREPLAQMQSAWYHAASFDFHNACKSCRAESFKAALESLLAGMKKDPPEFTPWLWTTMYARQLAPWLDYFNASQFYMIPMHQLTSDEKDGICRDLSAKLDFAVDCDSAGAESLHSWSHEHPPVDEDAGAEMRQAFDEFMAEENTRLVKLLAKANVNGMGLANYHGEVGDEESIRSWLESSW